MRALLGAGVAVLACALLAAGCGVTHPKPEASPPAPPAVKPHCAFRAGWQSLANKIGADVYCPGWLPDPLDGHIGAQDNDINSVGKNRSYLESFIWQDTDGPGMDAVHVNLRGYPGETTIPMCQNFDGNGMTPCFADPNGTVTENGIHATLYTVNQDADSWHLLYAWHHRGSLYAISEHLAPPLDYQKVIVYLKRELRDLVLIHPST
jgi:hypothetical protein